MAKKKLQRFFLNVVRDCYLVVTAPIIILIFILGFLMLAWGRHLEEVEDSESDSE